MRHLNALALAVALLATGSGAGAEGVGFVAVLHGDVQIGRGGSWQAASRDFEVSVGDAIRTGAGASVKIVLVDDTLLQIDEETELRLETWHVGDAATRDVSIVRQASGRLRTTVGDAFGGSTRVEVHIPTAAIGIKGTDFETIEGATWLACLISGGIVVTNDHGSGSPGAGQCIHAYADKTPGDPIANPYAPLVVDETGSSGGGRAKLVDRDVIEPVKVEVEVGAPRPLEPVVGDPFDRTLKNVEDELENFDVPAPPAPQLD